MSDQLTPWFNIGTDGPPHHAGRYYWELWMPDDGVIWVMGLHVPGTNFIITDDDCAIALTFEDYWQGVTK